MGVNDCGTCILFEVNCFRIAELQFTDDFGSVLLVNPRCIVSPGPRYWTGVDMVRAEYKRHFEKILREYHTDRIRIRK